MMTSPDHALFYTLGGLAVLLGILILIWVWASTATPRSKSILCTPCRCGNHRDHVIYGARPGAPRGCVTVWCECTANNARKVRRR